MGPDVDCPVCCVEKIRPTVSQCGVCEMAERCAEQAEALEQRVAVLEAELQREKDVAEGARQRADMAEKAMEEAQRAAGARAEALVREVKQAREAEREARAAVTLAHAPLANVWLWQGDGGDKPESLACPVVMSADTLRGLLADAERWKATAGWVPLSVREGATTPEEWAQRGEAFVRGLQEERERVRAALAKALAPPGGTVSGSLPLAVDVLAAERDGLRERMESCHAEHARTERALANARRFQESAARDRDALACEVERLTRQVAQLESDLHAAREQLETLEKVSEITNAAGFPLSRALPSQIDQVRAMAQALEENMGEASQRGGELANLKANLKAVLERIPGAVRVCEGGGSENLAASLAVSVAALASRVTAEEGRAQEAASRLEAVRTGAEQAIRTKDAALEQGRKALETLVERKSACGDQWAECPLQDAHKPGDDVQQAIAAMKAAERTGL